MLRNTALVAALVSITCLTACAHDVVWLADEPTPWIPPREPVGLAIAVSVQSFEAKRLVEKPYVDRFATALRESELFRGVIYPIPEGFEPLWELKLLVRDELYDPNSNLWKSALATMLLPLRFVLYQQEDYTVHVEALITRRDQVIGSYPADAPVRHRFQAYDLRKELEAAELIVRRSTDQILGAIAADADRLNAEDRRLAGS